MHSVRDRLGRGGGHPLAYGVGLRFLLDQDVYAATARHLADVGHDVVRAADLGLSRATDEQLLDVAREQGRLFVTRDRDFGRIVFLNRQPAPVLYLRMVPETQDAVHRELDDALRTHGERRWRGHSLSSDQEDIESEGSRITSRVQAPKIIRFSSESV